MVIYQVSSLLPHLLQHLASKASFILACD